MKSCLFECFRGMVNDIPVRGISRAIKLECWMMEDDLMHKRVVDMAEAVSILYFCQFIQAISHGENFFPVQLPIKHVAFYRDVVARLIEAGELPAIAKEKFDQTFSGNFLAALANN